MKTSSNGNKGQAVAIQLLCSYSLKDGNGLLPVKLSQGQWPKPARQRKEANLEVDCHEEVTTTALKRVPREITPSGPASIQPTSLQGKGRHEAQ